MMRGSIGTLLLHVNGPRARSSQDVETMDHRFMPLHVQHTEWSCLEPTSHLCCILAIRLAEFPGKIGFFTGNDAIAKYQHCGHNQEQYPQGIHEECYPQVQQRQRKIDRIATIAEGSIGDECCRRFHGINRRMSTRQDTERHEGE